MLRRLLRDASVYTLSTVLTAGLNLLLLPVYARLIKPAEYGTYDLVVIIGLFVGVTVALEITQAVMVIFSRSDDPVAKARIVSAGFWVVVVCFAIFFVLVQVFAPSIADTLFASRDGTVLVRFASGLYFATAVVRYWTIVGRASFHPWRVLCIAVGAATTSGVASVLAVLAGYGVEGLIAGQLVGQGAVAIIATAVHSRVLRVTPSRETVGMLMAFSAPLVFASASIVAAGYVDRILVREMLGLDALGIYGFAARIAGAMALLLIGFQSAIAPLIYSQLDRIGIHAEVARIFKAFVLIAGTAYLLLLIFAEPICRLIGGETYADSAGPARLLGAAVLIQGAYIFFPGLTVARRTMTLAIVNLTGFSTNVLASVVLIDVLGLTGAGIGALLGACVLAVLNFRLSQQHFAVPIFTLTR